jgi:hypothetical protein
MLNLMSKQALDRKLKELEALRASTDPAASAAPLRKALADRSNYYVSKAAALAAEFALESLTPDLVAAFERFLIDPIKSDPQCWAKNAIAKALKDLGYNDAAFFARGARYVQLEPVWNGSEDTATTLRGASALALAACPLPRLEILEILADLLAADSAKTVRAEAAVAIAQLSGPDSALLLRFKSLAGDREPEVTGQCLTSLLDISAGYVAFVARFLDSTNPDLVLEAAAALGASIHPAASETLIARYRATSDEALQRGILLSLGASRHAESADFLLSVIAEGNFDTASHAIRALAASRFREDHRARVEQAVRSNARLAATFEKEFV